MSNQNIVIEKFHNKLDEIFLDVFKDSTHLIDNYFTNNNSGLINFHDDAMIYIFFLMWRKIDTLTKSSFWSAQEILIILTIQTAYQVDINNDISDRKSVV